jgi:hypothetical protein
VDGSKVQLWVDGDVAGEGAVAELAGAWSSDQNILRIGAAAESGRTDHFLDGDVSDATLFSRPLTRHEIVALTEDKAMSPVVPVARESLVAHWPLRERSGTRAAGSSGNGRDAVLVNTPVLNAPGPSASTHPGTRALTRNVLHHMGLTRRQGEAGG